MTLKVTIGMPVYDTIKVKTAGSLISALLKDFPYDLNLTFQRGTYIAEGREMCVRGALAAKCDVLMFIDSDITFPPTAIRQLIEQGKDIIGGNYYEKGFPLQPTVKLKSFDGSDVFHRGVAELPDLPFKAGAVATGFMAINLHRLTACMAPPYFAIDAHGRPWRSGSLDGPGEDVAFCIRAQQSGLEVWCDPRIPLGHIGEHEYSAGNRALTIG